MNYYAEGLPLKEQRDIERYISSKEGKTETLSDAWKKNNHNLIYRALTILHENIGKDLAACDDDDVNKIMGTIKGSTEFSKNYKRLLVYSFRAFLVWYSKKYKTLSTFELLEIALPPKVWKTKKPKDMLTKQEFETVLDHCRHARDRCLIAMLWDGSNRPIELLNLKWEELIHDESGYYFITTQKTGKERKIRLTLSVPYVDAWKRHYPGDTSGKNPVFCTVNHLKDGLKPLSKANLDRIIHYLKESTGNTKLKPSIFRPSRITADVADNYDLPYIMKKNWGHLKTGMIDLYTNLDEEYIDQVALRKAGMERVKDMKEKETYKMEPPICPACGTLNVLGAEYCSKCITPLSENARMNKEFIEKELQSSQVEIIKQQQRKLELLEDQMKELMAKVNA